MKTILITGASGFIGKHLMNHIDKNKFNIVVLSSVLHSVYKTILHQNYNFSKENFLDLGVHYIDIVIHIGAFTPKSGSEANNIEKSNSNIKNTKHLLDNLPNIPSKFIFLSTLDVYGKIETKINEDCNTNPLTMYGWSKLYCEKMIETWAMNNNVIIQILRVGHVYGRGEEVYKKLIPMTISKIKNSENPQIFGTGNDKRSFIHIEDVCNLIINSINLNEYKGVINLCSSISYSIKEIIEILLEVSNKDFNIDFIKNDNSIIDFIFDTTKMNQLLGYENMNIIDGLRDEYYDI